MDRLTVIIRDEAPAVSLGEPATYRRVTVDLTDEQKAAMELKVNCRIAGRDIREQVSCVFLDGSDV